VPRGARSIFHKVHEVHQVGRQMNRVEESSTCSISTPNLELQFKTIMTIAQIPHEFPTVL
jgi:hypothetical protein